MSRHIHLNLIKKEELLSSSPVRSQLIAPIIAGVITLSTLTWWLLLYVNYSELKKLSTLHFNNNKQLQPGYTAVQKLNKEEKEITALIAQLRAFQNSMLRYGKLLTDIPKYVQPNIQFIKLEVLPPPPPLFEQNKESKGPTNTFETAGFLITGYTQGADAFNSVDKLLHALQSDAYTNLVETALIPKGSFRQDSKSGKGTQNLIFELKCECRKRRFE